MSLDHWQWWAQSNMGKQWIPQPWNMWTAVCGLVWQELDRVVSHLQLHAAAGESSFRNLGVLWAVYFPLSVMLHDWKSLWNVDTPDLVFLQRRISFLQCKTLLSVKAFLGHSLSLKTLLLGRMLCYAQFIGGIGSVWEVVNPLWHHSLNFNLWYPYLFMLARIITATYVAVNHAQLCQPLNESLTSCTHRPNFLSYLKPCSASWSLMISSASCPSSFLHPVSLVCVQCMHHHKMLLVIS